MVDIFWKSRSTFVFVQSELWSIWLLSDICNGLEEMVSDYRRGSACSVQVRSTAAEARPFQENGSLRTTDGLTTSVYEVCTCYLLFLLEEPKPSTSEVNEQQQWSSSSQLKGWCGSNEVGLGVVLPTIHGKRETQQNTFNTPGKSSVKKTPSIKAENSV